MGLPFSFWILKSILTLVIFGGALFLYDGPDSSIWFFWHPICALISMLPCMSIGIYAQQHNVKLREKQGKGGEYVSHLWHNLLMMAGVALIGFAIYVIYSNKNIFGKPHFRSWHGQMGLACVSGYLTVILTSLGVLWEYPRKMGWKPYLAVLRTVGLNIKTLATMHRYIGKALFLLACVTTMLGWQTTHAPHLESEENYRYHFSYVFLLPGLLALV